jgi:hypothetical protein
MGTNRDVRIANGVLRSLSLSWSSSRDDPNERSLEAALLGILKYPAN